MATEIKRSIRTVTFLDRTIDIPLYCEYNIWSLTIEKIEEFHRNSGGEGQYFIKRLIEQGWVFPGSVKQDLTQAIKSYKLPSEATV